MKEYIDEFIQNGFVIIPNVLSKQEIEKNRISIENVINKVNDAPTKYSTRYTYKDEYSFDTWGVNHIFELPLYEESFGELFYNPKIMEFLHGVLGKDLRWWCGHALWSPTKTDYDLFWHRDFGDFDYYDPTGNTTHVQFNVPLYEDSSFKAIPGSHKRPLKSLESLQLLNRGTDKLDGEVTANCNAGDVLFMNAHTFHRGSCSSGNFRRTLHLNVQSKTQIRGGHRTTCRLLHALDNMNPVVRELMHNAIQWDEENPMSISELIDEEATFQEKWKHQANKNQRIENT